MRMPPPRMNTLRFIFIAVVLMLLADTYLFGGKRSYIEEAKENYYAEQAQKNAEILEEEPLPVRVEPEEGQQYFEADLPEVEEMEEAIAVPQQSSRPEPSDEAEGSQPVEIKPDPSASLGMTGEVLGKAKEGPAKIAIIIDDLGMDLKHSRQVMDLPAPITLAFLPYGTKTREYAKIGIEKGHSLIIHVPMEAMDGKLNIGPGGLKASMDEATFNKNFDTILKSFDGYEGINNHMGSRLTQDSAAMKRVMNVLKERNLFFVDSKTINSSVAAKSASVAGVPYAERDVFLDHVESRAFVDKALAQTEQRALRYGSAIAIGHPKENTIAGLKAWIPTLKDKGIELVPVKELLVRPGSTISHPVEGRDPSEVSEDRMDPGQQVSVEPEGSTSTSFRDDEAGDTIGDVPEQSEIVPVPQTLQTELPAIY